MHQGIIAPMFRWRWPWGDPTPEMCLCVAHRQFMGGWGPIAATFA
eukprot:CAMPEP_0174385028 /NCGR_PEP_ID=MMETSP0811_2-20130205/126316_1 /TAXON_ID=73025 ORGANISM="Eutreptiella gymnastica-like, Strain CCMP1594" /NCGR_SAMPLE_ID=MMETSP0811_2 /ASSEMBLY_ACC=CAM_ASM_000667 /LENGTH=44 /DNA_ID= /DNA_START= /DNA_END= /DNA_ORIENTATION=